MTKILVVDDDATERCMISAAFKASKYLVIEAADGVRGLELAVSSHPDLVLCDLNMPKLSGYEVLEQLRSHPDTAAIPVILMTGGLNGNDMRHSMEQGADDYLLKPFDAPTLMAAVRMRLERKRAVEMPLQEIQSRLLSIVDATPSLIAMVDADSGKVTYCNPAGRTMLGIDAADELGMLCIGDCFLDEDGAQSFRKWSEIAKIEGRWIGECSAKNRKGQSIPVEIQVLAPTPQSEARAWLSVIARDLTGTYQLRQAQKLEAIGRLAAGIAHEINTPIQFTAHNLHFLQDSFKALIEALSFYDRLLAAAKAGAIGQEMISEVARKIDKADLVYLEAEVPAALQEALHGTERVAKIVGAMKEFSHPGIGNGHHPEPTNLRRAIESAITVARNEWKYVAEVVTEFESAMPEVPLYVGEFNQVILNLLVNAAHAISDATQGGARGKGTITLSTRRKDAWAEILIRDTGTGIDERVKRRIFEPFFTTKEMGRGTGQGLALAHSVIVEKHRGQLTFETEVGKGTCFIIRLPLAGVTVRDRQWMPQV